jgi:hypothetical protein
MPSMRVLLVRLFPKLLGTTNHSTNNYYVNNSNNRIGAGQNKQLNYGKHGEIGIKLSKSYTVQYGNQWEGDETSLVPMGVLASAKSNSGISVSEV